MADGKFKGAIPAWQRAQKSQSDSTPSQENNDDAKNDSAPISAEHEVESPAEPLAAEESALPDMTPDMTPEAQVENMKTFLEDAAVKNAPPEKKRAFFENKGISKDLIDQVLGPQESSIKASDFESFKQQRTQPIQTPPRQPQPTGPPIITYPEYLVEAHKPPPLITPARIVNTAYFAGGLAALIYGASKYLVEPMSASLNESRHDFALHSQSKIDEMNERLAKLVSKVPEPKKEKELEGDTDGSESESSDPTELYHRDIGTQTDGLPALKSSEYNTGVDTEKKGRSQNDYQSEGLRIIKDHLNEILAQSEKLEGSNKDRQDRMNGLRHDLDTMIYASSGISAWSAADDVSQTKNGDAGKEDAVEELKKEIRGVKGLMLNAKRFPGLAGRAGA